MGDRDLNSGVLIAISSNYGADAPYLSSNATQVSLVQLTASDTQTTYASTGMPPRWTIAIN